MNSSEIKFTYPVLGFSSDGDLYGFPDLDRLTKCGPRTLEDRWHIGMELVDDRLKRWRVLSVRRTGRAGSLLGLLWIFGPPQSRVEFELVDMPPISMKEVQERACKAMEHQKEDYYGEDGQKEYEDTLKNIGETNSARELYNLLNPDTFEGY